MAEINDVQLSILRTKLGADVPEWFARLDALNAQERYQVVLQQSADLSVDDAFIKALVVTCGIHILSVQKQQAFRRAYPHFICRDPNAIATPDQFAEVQHALAEEGVNSPIRLLRVSPTQAFMLGHSLGSGFFGHVHQAQECRLIDGQWQVYSPTMALKIYKKSWGVVFNLQADAKNEKNAFEKLYPRGSTGVDCEIVKTNDGTLAYTMPLLGNNSLENVLTDRELSFEKRLQLAIAICQQTQRLHQKEHLHGDIKTANIVVTESDDDVAKPRLIDLGISRHFGLGGRFGDPRYQPADALLSPLFGCFSRAQTDVYALGKVLKELLLIDPYCAAKSKHDWEAHASHNIVARLLQQMLDRRANRRIALSDVIDYLQNVAAKITELTQKIFEQSEEFIAGLETKDDGQQYASVAHRSAIDLMKLRVSMEKRQGSLNGALRMTQFIRSTCTNYQINEQLQVNTRVKKDLFYNHVALELEKLVKSLECKLRWFKTGARHYVNLQSKRDWINVVIARLKQGTDVGNDDNHRQNVSNLLARYGILNRHRRGREQKNVRTSTQKACDQIVDRTYQRVFLA